MRHSIDKAPRRQYVGANLERSNSAIRIGLLTDAMPDRRLEEVAGWAARTRLIQDLEIGVGGYSGAPHCDLDELLGNKTARRQWQAIFDHAGLSISALNVSGNPLHPNPAIAQRHDADLRKAIRLAAQLGVNRVVAMSGCPGARSEEHTSELQSQFHLVCRLLLEKKKKKQYVYIFKKKKKKKKKKI